MEQKTNINRVPVDKQDAKHDLKPNVLPMACHTVEKANDGQASDLPIQAKHAPPQTPHSPSSSSSGPPTGDRDLDENIQTQRETSFTDACDRPSMSRKHEQRVQEWTDALRSDIMQDITNNPQSPNALRKLILAKQLALMSFQKQLRTDVSSLDYVANKVEGAEVGQVLLEWRGARGSAGRSGVELACSSVDVRGQAPVKKKGSNRLTQEQYMEMCERHKQAHQQQEAAKLIAIQQSKIDEQYNKQQEQYNADIERVVLYLEWERHCIMEGVRKRHKHLREILYTVKKRENIQMHKQAKTINFKKQLEEWHKQASQRMSKAAEARIAALKHNDYAGYLKLVDTQKSTRLRELLEMTDSIIDSLGQSVHEQKKHVVGGGDTGVDGLKGGQEEGDLKFADKFLSSKEKANMSMQDRLIAGQKKYYNMVHAVQEEVQWPIKSLRGGVLRDYQKQGVQYLLSLYNNNINGILADEMGLGKTIQTLSFLAAIHDTKNNAGPHMILAPKAALPNWQKEVEVWFPSVHCVMYDGDKDQRQALKLEYLKGGVGRKQIANVKFNILLTHYDMALREKHSFGKIKWEYIIVDEGHRLKNSSSRLSEMLCKMNVTRRLLITGTPLQNNLNELWSLLHFLMPKVFSSACSFDDWFAAPFKQQGVDTPSPAQLEERLLIIARLHQVLRPFMLRRTKADVASELPSKVDHIIKVGLSPWQRLLYKQIAQFGQVNMEGGGMGSRMKTLNNVNMQLRKVCNHPFTFYGSSLGIEEERRWLISSAGKFVLLANILPKLRRTGHRVLIFSQMTSTIDYIQLMLIQNNIPFCRLDGTQKIEVRRQQMADFNAGGSPFFVFLLSTRAGGLGLNLQTADTVIIFDSDWNPMMDQQAEDRAHRIGQTKAVLVLVLVTGGTVEEQLQEIAREKRQMEAQVIQAGKFDDKNKFSENTKLIESLQNAEELDLVGMNVHTQQEINERLARDKDELILFNYMDMFWDQGLKVPVGGYPKTEHQSNPIPDQPAVEPVPDLDAPPPNTPPQVKFALNSPASDGLDKRTDQKLETEQASGVQQGVHPNQQHLSNPTDNNPTPINATDLKQPTDSVQNPNTAGTTHPKPSLVDDSQAMVPKNAKPLVQPLNPLSPNKPNHTPSTEQTATDTTATHTMDMDTNPVNKPCEEARVSSTNHPEVAPPEPAPQPSTDDPSGAAVSTLDPPNRSSSACEALQNVQAQEEPRLGSRDASGDQVQVGSGGEVKVGAPALAQDDVKHVKCGDEQVEQNGGLLGIAQKHSDGTSSQTGAVGNHTSDSMEVDKAVDEVYNKRPGQGEQQQDQGREVQQQQQQQQQQVKQQQQSYQQVEQQTPPVAANQAMPTSSPCTSDSKLSFKIKIKTSLLKNGSNQSTPPATAPVNADLPPMPPNTHAEPTPPVVGGTTPMQAHTYTPTAGEWSDQPTPSATPPLYANGEDSTPQPEGLADRYSNYTPPPVPTSPKSVGPIEWHTEYVAPGMMAESEIPGWVFEQYDQAKEKFEKDKLEEQRREGGGLILSSDEDGGRKTRKRRRDGVGVGLGDGWDGVVFSDDEEGAGAEVGVGSDEESSGDFVKVRRRKKDVAGGVPASIAGKKRRGRRIMANGDRAGLSASGVDGDGREGGGEERGARKRGRPRGSRARGPIRRRGSRGRRGRRGAGGRRSKTDEDEYESEGEGGINGERESEVEVDAGRGMEGEGRGGGRVNARNNRGLKMQDAVKLLAGRGRGKPGPVQQKKDKVGGSDDSVDSFMFDSQESLDQGPGEGGGGSGSGEWADGGDEDSVGAGGSQGEGSSDGGELDELEGHEEEDSIPDGFD